MGTDRSLLFGGDINEQIDWLNQESLRLQAGECQIIDNPSDVEAFQNFVDRFGSETPVQVFDIPKTSAELKEVDNIIAERLRESSSEVTEENQHEQRNYERGVGQELDWGRAVGQERWWE